MRAFVLLRPYAPVTVSYNKDDLGVFERKCSSNLTCGSLEVIPT